MPINPNSISWDSAPKIGGPAPDKVEWDQPAARPGYYSDGSTDYHNKNGVLGFLQTADRMSGRGAERIAAGIGRAGEAASNLAGLPQGVTDWFHGQAVGDEAQAAAPVPGAVHWDDVKADPSAGNIASYIGQGAIGATPDLAAALVAPWAYGASRTGEIAHERAANNGHGDNATLGDVAIAAPVAAADTALMRFGLGGILGGEGYGLVKGAVRAAGRDAIMGAGQPVLDYGGATLGTDQRFDWNEAGDRAAAGAVAMAPFGVAAHLAVRGARATGSKGEPAPAAPPQTVRQQLSPEEADALTLHGIDVDTLEDVNMARKAAERLLAKAPAANDAPAVIATAHGNVAPNADAQGRDFGTIDANGGAERTKFERAVGGVENATGNHNAQNPRSSASGDFQFTDDTFVRTYQRRFGNGESRESILAKKNDPRLQSVMMRDLTDANEDVMRRSGVPLTAGNYYLAHFAGSGGAVKLHRNLDKPVEAILGQKAVDANPFLKGMTGRDVIAWASQKMHGGKADVAAAGHVVDYPVRPSDRGDASTYRAPDHSEFEGSGYHFDPAEAPQPMGKAGAHDTGTMGDFENMDARQSKTAAELNRPGARGEGMATGGMERPFKADASTGDFENVARENVKRAEAERETRFEARRAEAERLKAEFEARKNRAGQSDASSRYQQFGSKPHFDTDTGFHRTTADGFVADEAGNPVVWPTQGAAAKWAARFKMGGDFELQAHGTSKRGGEQPVTLQRKPGSTYGEQAAPRDAAAGDAPPQLEHIQWHDETAPAEPANLEGGDKSAAGEANRNLPPEDKFPADYTPDEARAVAAKRAFDSANPGNPGREPGKPTSFFSDVATHLANESKRTGVATKIDAEDAINHGVPAEAIYHNPNDRYPTVKANAAKVFASSKAPLKSRAKPGRVVPLDHIGDSFNPRDYGVAAGDGVQAHRLAPEHAGDLLRRSMEGDNGARNQSHANFDEHKAWTERMDALQSFEAKFGDDWTKLSDDQLAELDPSTFDAFYDDVLQAAERPDVDPFDPRFWENESEQSHQGQGQEPEVSGRGREDIGRAERDGQQPNDGAHRSEDGGLEASRDLQSDAFGERAGDQRRALERKGDEPLRGKKAQKAPGSDGGLFDDASHSDQGTLLHDKNTGFGHDMFRDLPRNAIPDGVLKDGMEADRAFNWIAEHSKDDFHQQLANTLLDLTNGVKISLYDRVADLPADYASALREAHGAVIHRGGQARIFLNTAKFSHGLSEETLLHEGIHAAIAMRVGGGALRNVHRADVDAARGFGQDVRRIGVLQRLVADHIQMLDRTGKFREKNFAYETMKAAQIASENVDEFLTYALTDKEFQRMLADIKVQDTNAQTSRLSVWQQFVNIARRVVGLDAKYKPQFEKLLDADNALNSAIDTFNDHVGRLDDTPAHEQSDAEFDRRVNGKGDAEQERRQPDEFGRRPPFVDRGETDPVIKAARERDRRFAESDRRSNIIERAKWLIKDEGGALNLDGVATVASKIFDLEGLKRDRDTIRAVVGEPKNFVKGAFKSLDRFGSAVGYSSDGTLRTLSRHFDAPAIAKVADMFQARAGAADSTERTYFEALTRNFGRFRSRLDAAVTPFLGQADAMARVRDLVADPAASPAGTTAAERAGAKEIRTLLKDVHQYRREAGEELGEVENYFPRVLNTMAVAKSPEAFKRIAADLYRKVGADDPVKAAENWLLRTLDTHAGLDGGAEFIRAGSKPNSAKAREFGAEADKALREFYHKDPLLVLSDHITGAVRKAEQTRRFGAKGAEGSPEREAWERAHGSKTQWDVALDEIKAQLRASGEDAHGVPEKVASIKDGMLGRLTPFGAKASATIATLHAWNQLSTLQRVTLSSVGDTAMGFVRTGEMSHGVRHFAHSIGEAVRVIRKAEPSDARRWAEAMGTAAPGTAAALIQSRMDANPGMMAHSKLLDSFYKKVGITQLTEGGRTAATETAQIMIDTLAHDLSSPKARTRQRATFYLKELGIKDPEAFGQWVRDGGATMEAVASDKGHAADYATATIRFADQSIMMPTRAQKPAWANHPVGTLVFALQSYNAAFTQNVLKRVGRLGVEAVKTKDLALLKPAAGLIALAGVTMLQDALRQQLFGASVHKDKSQTAGEAERDYALRIIDRMGMTGILSPFFNALQGLRYKRPLSQSLSGAIIGRAGDAADTMAGLYVGNTDHTNTAERRASAMLYDMAIDPAVNAFGAGRVKGGFGTALILGTGNRKDGVLPGDRDAFVDWLAGPKSESGGHEGRGFGGSGGRDFGGGNKRSFGGR